jgi:hypothetical protein
VGIVAGHPTGAVITWAARQAWEVVT